MQRHQSEVRSLWVDDDDNNEDDDNATSGWWLTYPI
jgi:hypothetical protein